MNQNGPKIVCLYLAAMSRQTHNERRSRYCQTLLSSMLSQLVSGRRTISKSESCCTLISPGSFGTRSSRCQMKAQPELLGVVDADSLKPAAEVHIRYGRSLILTYSDKPNLSCLKHNPVLRMNRETLVKRFILVPRGETSLARSHSVAATTTSKLVVVPVNRSVQSSFYIEGCFSSR